MRNRIAQKRPLKNVKYASDPTRYATLQGFMGGAEFISKFQTPMPLPGEQSEHLEKKFKSGVNRTDMPRMWGHPSVDRHLGRRKLSLANDIRDWRRQGGEPLYKKG